MSKKHLGIDYGAKRIGVAISDESGTLAFPNVVHPNNKKLLDTITALCESESVSAIVLGESVNFQGKDNPIMEHIHRFKDDLEKHTSLPVYFEQEFLTSAEAAREFGEDESHDARAAALILQRFLDKQETK